MFLHSLRSSDPRFKGLTFNDGMNILLADRTSESTTGDSRNGAGKSSFVKILRYILGGNLDKSLKNPDLRGSVFRASLRLEEEFDTIIERPSASPNQVTIDGLSQPLNDWKSTLATEVYGLPLGATRPTVSQLTSQLVRTYFHDAIKTFPQEAKIDSNTRIGYFLGFSPEILGKAAEVNALEKHRKELRKAIRGGALPSLSIDDAELRAQLASAKSRQGRLKKDLASFRVDEQYTFHQRRADDLSSEIARLNEIALALHRRKSEIERAIEIENPAITAGTDPADSEGRLEELYAEVGLVLPDTVRRRFDEVVEFHGSVIRNRQLFLQSELDSTKERLRLVDDEIRRLDAERAEIMDLLQQSMALETFQAAQTDLTQLESSIADLQHRLEQAEALTEGQLRLKAMSLQSEKALRSEQSERASLLNDAMALFSALGEEIYSDRAVSLRIGPTSRGVLDVSPEIDGDASTGISEVKTFLLDIVCLVSAIRNKRAPRMLVHDSLLFDSMDDRQAASCLNIGARLAEEHGFQYIVTMNSDRLDAIEHEGFDGRSYVIAPVLTDRGENGGLFGFRFK